MDKHDATDTRPLAAIARELEVAVLRATPSPLTNADDAHEHLRMVADTVVRRLCDKNVSDVKRSDLSGKLRALADRLNGGNLRKHPNEDEVRAAASLIERFETWIDPV
jgi:hypothetical protein